MKKITAIFTMAMLAVCSLFLFTACSPGKAGDEVYAISTVEENESDYTADSFSTFNINLFEDGTYRVDFKAKGMPMTLKETGTYDKSSDALSFVRAEGSRTFIVEILAYEAKAGTIKAVCKGSGDTANYTAVFTRTGAAPEPDDHEEEGETPGAAFTEGTYVLTDIDAGSGYTLDTFATFDIVFESGNYTVNFQPKGAPMVMQETGTYVYTAGALVLTKTGARQFIASIISYDPKAGRLEIMGKGMGGGADYTATFSIVTPA